MIKTKKQMFIILTSFLMIILLGTVTYAFFNYTRTGAANTFRVGKIYFTSGETNTINLVNVFPITRTAAATDTDNTGEVTISISGDTTYENGIEYVVSLEDVNIKTNGNRNIPVGLIVTPEKTGELGTAANDYFDNGVRGGFTSYYKVVASEVVKNGDYILVGYIRPGVAQVNGTIGIKAFIDSDRILISDTYDGTESDNMGTSRQLANGKVVITTSEWNALQTNGVSFKVKVQANEGIWVGEPTSRNDLTSSPYDATLLTSEQRTLATEVNFIRMSEEMINTHSNLIDLTAFGGNGVVKAWFEGTKLYIASPGEIYFPSDSTGLLSGFSNVTKFRFDNVNTSLVTNMSGMISSNPKLEYLDLSSFDTSSVTDMDGLFYGCERLRDIDFTGIDTSNVTVMSSMFAGCLSLTSLDLSNFDTSKVKRMNRMFVDCNSLTSLDLSNFDTGIVRNMSGMFYGCSGLTSLNISSFDTYDVTDMSGMFMGCLSLTSLDLSSFNTRNVEDMTSMFQDCSSLITLDLSSFNTISVASMYSMFYRCRNLTSLNVSSFNTSSATNMGGMFADCNSLTSLDVSSFNTSLVENMAGMFSNCSSLTSLNLSNFNTVAVTNMSGMFNGCSSLTSLNLSSFNTGSVANMNSMFYRCTNLTSLNVSSFNTSSVQDMSGMFANCENLTSLDLSGFTLSSVTASAGMFYECYDLVTIEVGNSWNTSNITTSVQMFTDCSSLVGGSGTTYDANYTDKTYAHVDGGSTNPGYLTLKSA